MPVPRARGFRATRAFFCSEGADSHPRSPLSCRSLLTLFLFLFLLLLPSSPFVPFAQHHVEWSLGFGSLLTALRSDGASNPYDYDADIIVYYKGYTV